MASANYWIGVAVLEHIKAAVSGGFVQLGHGKEAPVRRLRSGDWVLLYASRPSLQSQSSLSAFAAIGRVLDDNVYQVQQDQRFCPFRRDVSWFPDAKQIEIRPFLTRLSFTKKRGRNWGMAFRRSSFQIPLSDFQVIQNAMGVEADDGQH